MGFTLLLGKNFKVELRSLKKTLFEIVIIIVICSIVLLNPVDHSLNFELTEETALKTRMYENTALDELSHFKRLMKIRQIPIQMGLAYTPVNDFTRVIAEETAKKLQLARTYRFKDEFDLEDRFNKKTMFAGVVFAKGFDSEKDSKLNVIIRFPSEFRTSPVTEIHNRHWVTRCSGVITANEDDEEIMHTDLYIREGFLQLQHQLFMTWMEHKEEPSIVATKVYVRSFQQHTDKELCEPQGSSNLIMFLYYFTFFYPFLNLVWRYGRERQENIPAHHWKYGLSFRTFWLSHFIVSLLHFMLLDIIIIGILMLPFSEEEAYGTFIQNKFPYVALLLITCNIALIVFAMFLAAIMVNAKNSVLCGAVIWMSCYGIFSVVVSQYHDVKSYLLLFSFVLFFNNGFGYGMKYLKESTSNGGEDDAYMMGSIGASALVYLIFLILLSCFNPGRYVQRSAKSKSKKKKKKGTRPKTVVLPEVGASWHNFEFGPLKSKVLVRLHGVSTFPKERPYLRNISMRFYAGEINVILGSHSSGKTTLISLIAGWSRPDSGQIEVNDANIQTQWKTVRNFVDVSMPNNPLFDLLTAEETLYYFVRTKMPKVDARRVNEEVIKWMDSIRPALVKKHALVKTLKFEQKRLLHLCCVLACGTKVVLLDEPTLHMRNQESRLYHSILQREKPDRTIIMTTFSVDEAEAFGDRIALLYGGRLIGQGTPFFLKTRFGLGYDLVIVKHPHADVQAITELLDKFIPGIQPENEIGDQLIYKVPIKHRAVYQNMLINLEKQSTTLGIVNLSFLGSQVSEVFNTLGARKNKQAITDDKQRKWTFVKKNKLRKQQISALFYKKLLLLAPNFIPVLAFFVGFLLILLISQMSSIMRIPPKRYNSINLGLNATTIKRTFFAGLDQCNFVEIREVQRGVKSGNKLNTKSRIFDKNSMKCEKKNQFSNYITKSKTLHDKYGAVERTKDGYTCWVNLRMFHSAPLTLNLLHNMLLQKPFVEYKSVLTTVINQPMPTPLRAKLNLLDQQLTHLIVPVVVGSVIPVTIACFILPLVEERRYHMLRLQRMCGINMRTYWIVNMIWDYWTFFSYAIVYVIILAFTSLEGFGLYDKMLTFMLINIYAFPAILMIYLLAMFFYTSLTSSFLIALLVQITTGIFAYVMYWDVLENNRYFFYIASIFPAFSLLDGISNVYSATKEEVYCEEKCRHNKGCNKETMCEFLPECCGDLFFQLEDPGLFPSILFMLGASIVLIILISCFELRRRERKFHGRDNLKHFQSAAYPYDDRAVVDVKKAIAETDLRGCLRKRFMVDQLEDYIPKKGNDLRTISFELDKHMCMCIYGTRHSGKSHLVKQLIGEHGFLFGDIYVNGRELKLDYFGANEYLSYCPQDYGYFGIFTPRELLRVLCMLRGQEISDIADVIRSLSSNLDMGAFLDKRINSLSVEKVRKVNIALALIALHKIIVLDEPTRGMPPHTCREIWNVLRYKRFCGKTLIVTTTETTELEALADTVLIYDEGEMLGIGNVQVLRQKFSYGFYLEFKLSRDGDTAEEVEANLFKDSENLNRFVTFIHEESELRARIDNWFRYYVPAKNVIYSHLIGALEKNRRRLNVADYTVNQASMYDVMKNIMLTRKHKEYVTSA